MKINFSIAALYLLLQLNQHALADTETRTELWELGVGIGSVYGPDYRGSDEYRNFTSIIPYVVYYGKIIRSDREGLKAEFFSTDRINFSLSASAYISPDSDENKRRENMPALGSTIELGPSLNFRLTGSDLRRGWHIHLPWRAVFAIGGDDNKMIGSVFHPQLVYTDTFADWLLRYRAGAMFGSNSYHDYYYSVESQYATAERTEFNAAAGYSGFTTDLALSRQISISNIKTRAAFFIRYDNLNNVEYSNSPLFMSEDVLRAGLALIWVIK